MPQSWECKRAGSYGGVAEYAPVENSYRHGSFSRVFERNFDNDDYGNFLSG